MSARLQLSFPNETRAKLALSIPLNECYNFAANPLKWFRFLGFAIYGREGPSPYRKMAQISLIIQQL
jgi:hypothetical protein